MISGTSKKKLYLDYLFTCIYLKELCESIVSFKVFLLFLNELTEVILK